MLEYALLGLIKLRPGVTGYELNNVMKKSTGYMLSTSLSHIYPALKKMHDQGLVAFEQIPLGNRPTKKTYMITKKGETKLQHWLAEPVVEDIDFDGFRLKMSFSPLMTNELILQHIEREIAYQQNLHANAITRKVSVEMKYLDKKLHARKRTEALWQTLLDYGKQTCVLRINWLKEWHRNIRKNM